MGRYLRECSELGDRAAEMEEAAEMEAAAGGKRKVYLGESELSTSKVQHKTPRLAAVSPENSASSETSGNSSCETAVAGYNASASCCSSNGSSELTKETSKFVDLEDTEVAVEHIATSAGDSLDNRERRETTPLRESQAESSTARPRESSPRRRSAAEKMPTEAELEEFFATAEKKLQQKFIDKYNYDIVKDQPLDGRYEWVKIQIKP